MSHRFIMAMGAVGTCRLSCNSPAVADGLVKECLRADVGGDTVRALVATKELQERHASGDFVTTKLGSCGHCGLGSSVFFLPLKADGDSGDCGIFGIGGTCG